MEATETTILVDQDGDPLPDTLPSWLEVQRERMGLGRSAWVAYLSTATKSHVRTVERWRAGSRKPDAAVCRALRLALASPMEAEAMRCLQGALRALQGAQAPHNMKVGGGGTRGRNDGLASPAPPTLPPPTTKAPEIDYEALALAMECSPDDAREIVRRAAEAQGKAP